MPRSNWAQAFLVELSCGLHRIERARSTANGATHANLVGGSQTKLAGPAATTGGAWTVSPSLMLVDVVHQGRPGRQLRDPILLAVDGSTLRRRNNAPGDRRRRSNAGLHEPLGGVEVSCFSDRRVSAGGVLAARRGRWRSPRAGRGRSGSDLRHRVMVQATATRLDSITSRWHHSADLACLPDRG